MQLADVLIFADEDKVYGIKKAYYPDIKRAVDSGCLLVLPYDGWHDAGLRLKSKPRCNGEDVYIRNPYSNCFIPVSDAEILDSFISDKSLVIKEALVWMGAKDIVLDESVKNVGSQKGALKADATVGVGKGSLNVNMERLELVNIRSLIESHDSDRKPKSIEKVEEFLQEHGLANETKLTLLADRLREEGKLSGQEKYTVTYLNEVQFALGVLAGIDYKVFSGNLDFSRENVHLHSIDKVLTITF